MRKPTLKAALETSVMAIDDWLNIYASDFCDEERVREASQRIRKAGGTLAYIALVQQINQAALSRAGRAAPADDARKRTGSRRKVGG